MMEKSECTCLFAYVLCGWQTFRNGELALNGREWEHQVAVKSKNELMLIGGKNRLEALARWSGALTSSAKLVEYLWQKLT